MTAPDLTKLTLAELRSNIVRLHPEGLGYGRCPHLDELHRRAQANDALRSHAETVRKERESRNRGGADDCFTDNARSRQRESEAIESILSLLAAAPPTPSAPVTDAEIEAAIVELERSVRKVERSKTQESMREADLREDAAQKNLRALIARRVASAGAAPVDSEREAAIEAWHRKATCAPEGGYSFTVGQDEIDEAVCLMRSAPPAPAGDQDAKLRELREWAERREDDDGFTAEYRQCAGHVIAEIDRLLAAPAASAIAAAPEAPAWREKLDAAAAEFDDVFARNDKDQPQFRFSGVDEDLGTLRDFVLALREQVESHARRIEALERAAQEGSK